LHFVPCIGVGTQFIASTNLLKEFGGVWIPLNKLVDAINWVPTVVINHFG
jgi:hypothetical protein